MILEAWRPIDEFEYECRAESAFKELDNWAYFALPVIGANALITKDFPKFTSAFSFSIPLALFGTFRAPSTLPSAMLSLPHKDPSEYFRRAPTAGRSASRRRPPSRPRYRSQSQRRTRLPPYSPKGPPPFPQSWT